MEVAVRGVTAGDGPDWAGLTEEILLIIMEALEIPDIVRSGGVCTSWNAAYATFRRLRLPLPTSSKQLPCLLYACDAYGPDAAAVYCPFTGDFLRVPFPLPPLSSHAMVGSAHGWLVTADEVSNLRLLNPITGAHAALPPITTIHNVESFLDADGRLMYNLFDNPRLDPGGLTRFPGGIMCYPLQWPIAAEPEPTPFAESEARDWMYHRVSLSCSPASGSACTALLVRMPLGELSYARLGDERWTWISPDEHPCIRASCGFVDSFYDEAKAVFYVLRCDRSMYAVNLNGPSPVVTKIMPEENTVDDPETMYLLRAPWGDILQICRWRSYIESSTPAKIPDDLKDDYDGNYPYLQVKTTDIEVFKVDLAGQKLVKMSNLAGHALFLGYNGAMCLPTEDFPVLKPNCAYITDDSFQYVNQLKYNWREIGIWDIQGKSLESFSGCARPTHPWLNWPSPVWLAPSLF